MKVKLPRTASGRGALAAGVVSALVAGGIVVLAVQAPGYVNTAVDLTDSAVWVTNSTEQLVGRLNRQIDELNSAVAGGSSDLDVLQQGELILVQDGGTDQLRVLDPGTVTLGSKTDLPGNAQVSLGDTVVGIADRDSGSVWLGQIDKLGGFDPATEEPAAALSPGVAVAAAVDGTVFAVSPAATELTTLNVDADGLVQIPVTTPFPGGALSDVDDDGVSPISVTAVGTVAVVLDRLAGQVIIGDRRVSIPDAETAVLQQPGAPAGSVLVATSTALLRIPLAEGEVEVLISGEDGPPTAPVYLLGCAHAAWSGTQPSYGLACGSDPASVVDVPKATEGAELQFRVNRKVIVLNDVSNGNVWLVDSNMNLIDDWTKVRPNDENEDDTANEGDQESVENITTARAECKGQVDIPDPSDDNFGVRAGRTTVLRVLDNDVASECSMFTIGSVTPLPENEGIVSVVQNGSALQVSVPQDAPESLPTISYGVTDGAGHNDATANVSITVIDPDVTLAPARVRFSSTVVEVAGKVTYNVLGDWRSPNGDDLFLASALPTGDDDEVTYLPDGTITFQDKGIEGAGKKVVNFIISDGVETAAGTLSVDVRDVGTTEPYGSPIFAKTVVGEPVTIFPLRSVLSPAAEAVRLTGVAAQAPNDLITASANAGDGTITAKGAAPGSYYFDYQVAAGGADGGGTLRVDVVEKPTEATAPVAMVDTAYLVDGRTVLVDPTANDFDPMGGVLALQQVTQQGAGDLTITTTDMHLLQISAVRPLDPQGAVISYQVSNGLATSTGQVRVVPVPIPEKVAPPTVSPASVVVRAGDAVTIPISKYAYDPSGEPLVLLSPEQDPLEPGQGLLFNTETAIRYLAPAAPPDKPIRFSYTVQNQSGKKSTELVDIQVTPADPAQNAAPKPPAVAQARVFVNQTVEIALPLDGVDPDGDWVVLSGIDSGSTAPLGLATAGGTGVLQYKAFSQPGLDTVNYVATDPYGLTVSGTMKVVVVPAPTTAEPPVAPNLEVSVLPGRSIGIDVLGSVIDPANEVISFDDIPFEAPTAWATKVSVADGQLVVAAPTEETIQSIKYNVINSSGLPASGLVTVTVSKDAVVLPPTAADAFITPDLVTVGAADTAGATVDVTDLITNPSGQSSDLVLTMDAVSAEAATADGREITVAVLPIRQVLAYVVTSPLDDLSAKAFVVVPSYSELGLDQDSVPKLKDGVAPLEVTAGEQVTVLIADYVTIGDGSVPKIADGAEITDSTHGQAGRVDENSLKYTAEENSSGEAVLNVPVVVPDKPATYVGIPVTVKPKVVPPPVFASLEMPVEVGTTESRELIPLVTTVNAEQQAALAFSLTGQAPAGFQVGISGSTLTATVDAATPKNTVATVTMQVTDGPDRPPVTATVTITAKGSNAPLPRVADFEIPDARPGVAVTQDLLSGAVDPIGKGLTVDEVVVESGDASVSAPGSSITITPSVGKVGTITIRYTVSDITKDPDREVFGRVVIQVQDKPAVPGTPSVVRVQSKTVELRWTEPVDNGLPIDSYKVSDGANAFSQTCTTTPCTLTGLTNNVTYTFTVSAHNSAGWSADSNPSAQARPDQVPDRPAPPAPTYANADKLTVNWNAPTVDGSPISEYELSISPADLTGTSVKKVTGTSYVWEGLKNGTDYSFSVIAINLAGKSASSGNGAAEHPSAPPVAPAAPAVTFGPSDYSASGNKLTVSWAPPSELNGDPVTGYTVYYTSSAGSSTIKVGPNVSTAPITGVQDGVEYTATVSATNRSGESSPSGGSTARPFSPPPQVTGVTAAATGNTGQVNINWSPVSGKGRDIAYYEVTSSAGVRRANGPSASFLEWPGLNDGTNYSFSVTAFYSSNDAAFNQSGPVSAASASVYPYSELGTPVFTRAEKSGQNVGFNWNWPAPTGAPMEYQATVNGASIGGPSGYEGSPGYSQTVTVVITVCDNPPTGRRCTTDMRSITTDPPPPTTWVRNVPTGSCVQNTPRGPSNFHPNNPPTVPATCDSYFARGDQTFYCYNIWTWYGAPNTVWLRLGDGWSVSADTVTGGRPTDMPAC